MRQPVPSSSASISAGDTIEIIEPRRHEALVTGAHADLAAHTAALAVCRLISEVIGIFGLVHVQRLGDQRCTGASKRFEAPQQTARLRGAREQSEVVAEHEDRVEHTQLGGKIVDRQHLRALETALFRDGDRERRDVDAEHVELFLLEVQRVATRAAADVEHSAVRVAFQRLSFMRRPKRGLGEIVGRAARDRE